MLTPISQCRLLIIACTATKRHEVRLLPAIERYCGPSFRVLRRWLSDHSEATTRLDVSILSAEFGLIPAIQPIPDYDRHMTAARAVELRAQVRATLEHLLALRSYTSIYLSAGQIYRQTLGDLSTITGLRNLSTAPDGAGIGTQLGALKRWLMAETS
ncbi:MAG: DUF6884 domain-containing protein [Oscillochloridaceae bacterium umkhey_bin13]